MRDDDVIIPYMVNRVLHSKHHATFLTGRSPAAASREAKGFMSSKQFFLKKITVKYNIYNQIVLLEERKFTTTVPGIDDWRFWVNG